MAAPTRDELLSAARKAVTAHVQAEQALAASLENQDIAEIKRLFGVLLSASQALAEAITRYIEAQEPDPGDVLAEGRIFVHEGIAAPIDVAAGQWTELQTIAMVVKLNPSGRHQKFIGAASSQSAGQGAFGIGVNRFDVLDIWRAGGGQSNQLRAPPTLTTRKASLLIVSWSAGTLSADLDGVIQTGPLATPLAAINGPSAIGRGYWGGNPVDPSVPVSEIRAMAGWSRELTASDRPALRELWASWVDQDPDLLPPVDPPPPPPVDGGKIEPENGAALQVAIEVGTEPRQSWHGFGYGLNNWAYAPIVFPRFKAHIDKLTTDINASIMRIFTPEDPGGCLKAYKPYWDLLKERGVDTIFASCFLYRRNGTPAGIAIGVKSCIDGGMTAPRWALSIQNEPDGNPANAVKGDFRQHSRDLRRELDARGLQHVEIVGLEWRHPPKRGPGEFDDYDAQSMVGPGKAVASGCIHIYDKGPDAALYDNRYMKRGAGIWSTELGNNGSPNAQARMLAGINHGTVCELVHYCMVATPSPNPEQKQQALLDWNGVERPWYGGLQVISTALARGTAFRLCTSSDRPSGLPAGHAQRMARNAEQTGGRNPRQQVAAGLRPDGKWVVLAVNATHDGEGFNPYTSGHYGEALQQITVTIPDLAGRSGSFEARRSDINGGVSGPDTVGMENGRLRFTLRGGETIALVGR